jgi:hypothetical protein
MASLFERRERISMITGAFMLAYAFSIDTVQAFLVILNILPFVGEFLNSLFTLLMTLWGYFTVMFWLVIQRVSPLKLMIKHPLSTIGFMLLEFFAFLPFLGAFLSFVPLFTIWTARIIFLAYVDDKKYDEKQEKKSKEMQIKIARRLQREASYNNRPYRRPLTPAYEEVA